MAQHHRADAASDSRIALFHHLPELAGRVPWIPIGDWPTPVQELPRLRDITGGTRIFVKREDASNARYGGNKVRTLEAMLGRAVAAGADCVWATGAFGSNHALATVTHAHRAGLRAGVALFPQPATATAAANLRAILSMEPELLALRSPLTMPIAVARLRQERRSFVMTPGGATPEGTFGAISAALELAQQVEAGVCPPPKHIVLAVGSTCTTAGLMVGLELASRLGLGFGAGRAPLPKITAVRVVPWPVTSAAMIVQLAYRAAHLVCSLVSDIEPIGLLALRRRLTIDRHELGPGYGATTPAALRAVQVFREAAGPALDVVYSAKAGARALAMARAGQRGPILFWATKSSAPLPAATESQIASAPRAMQRWLSGKTALLR